ncbi:MAG TPA: hypothetical protein VNO20_10825 [Solirubrobacterales bacterium]|nr:hypothetical protein [Solirubrobacterales bacterium]
MKEIRDAATDHERSAQIQGSPKSVGMAVDAGELTMAEAELESAKAALASAENDPELRIMLALSIQEAAIALYRGDSDETFDLAEQALDFAETHFSTPGIEVGRARLQLNFALESRLDYSAALQANRALESELIPVAGAQPLRLNCLTRAIACAVKNADRGALRESGFRAEAIRESLSWPQHGRILSWHFLWLAVASLRQGGSFDVKRLLDHVEFNVIDPGWRWCNAASFVEGRLGSLHRSAKAQGIEIHTVAAMDAEERGFHGHLRSIDAGVNGPEV